MQLTSATLYFTMIHKFSTRLKSGELPGHFKSLDCMTGHKILLEDAAIMHEVEGLLLKSSRYTLVFLIPSLGRRSPPQPQLEKHPQTINNRQCFTVGFMYSGRVTSDTGGRRKQVYAGKLSKYRFISEHDV